LNIVKYTDEWQTQISSAIGKMLPAAQGIRKWTPSLGHVYQLPANTVANKSQPADSNEVRPSNGEEKQGPGAVKANKAALDRLAEESFTIHMKYGGEFIDENPITGRPGEFHLSSTGRKEKPAPQTGKGLSGLAAPTINTKLADDGKKDAKAEKSPKTPTIPKPKRRKSKIGSASAP
jgi:mediator of RNA polymerase II transcription subunit 6